LLKKWFIFLALVVLATTFVVGCSDDDDDAVTSTVPATFTNGEIYIDDSYGVYFYVYTFVHGSGYPEVDSIKIDTMYADVYSSYYWNYADPYWYCDFYEDEDPSAYESGDNITVSMYGSGRSSSCNITLLDYDDDETEVISPSYGTYVDTGATVEVVWNEIDNAEYYAIYMERRYDSSGSMEYDETYTFTYDTTFTVPERYTDSTVDYFYFYVMPTCGPDPTSYTGNWTGDLTTGVLYSRADYDYTRVYVTAGGPPPKVNPMGKEDDPASDKSPREIIQGLYGLNR